MGPSQVGPQLPPPSDTSSVRAWQSQMLSWRRDCAAELGYVGGAVGPTRLPGMRWTQTSYVQAQVHTFDLFLWDPVARNHTVQRFLADLSARYGGLDSVLLWPTYTNMGIDQRNTNDMVRSMPGGTSGVRALVSAFHDAGVRVLWPYHPWDTGTRRELCGDFPGTATALDCTPGQPLDDASAVAALLLASGADGVNGDTMTSLPRSFYTRGTQVTGRPVAMEAEMGMGVDSITWSTLAWGEGWGLVPAREWVAGRDLWPMIAANKWVTGGSYMVHLTDRWSQSKAAMAGSSWFNGVGLNSWENVWGVWNGLTPRDAEIFRRVGAMLRFAGGHSHGGEGQADDAPSNRSLLRSADWRPFQPLIHAVNGPAFASSFFSDANTGEVFICVVGYGAKVRTNSKIHAVYI